MAEINLGISHMINDNIKSIKKININELQKRSTTTKHKKHCKQWKQCKLKNMKPAAQKDNQHEQNQLQEAAQHKPESGTA